MYDITEQLVRLELLSVNCSLNPAKLAWENMDQVALNNEIMK